MKKDKEKKNFLLDSDRDGLSDKLEERIGTDPHKADTDEDSVSDFEEICRNSNPRGEGNLSNLFIPSKDNNYQPRILQPKRVFFWLGSSLIIEVIIIIFVLLFPLIVWLTPDLMREESAKIIDLTNQLRVRQGVSNLKTSELLAQAAYQKAEDMLYQQYFSHIGPNQKKAGDWASQNGYQYLVIGENLAMGFAGSEEVVNAWVKSPTHYANLIDPLYQEIGVGMVSGPFQGQDTTLVAQFFARPTKFQPELPSEEAITEEPEETIAPLEEPLTAEIEPELEVEPILPLEPDLEIVEEIISERTREEVLSFEENNREIEKEEDEIVKEEMVISEEFQSEPESVLGERTSLEDNQILDEEELNGEDFSSPSEEKVLGEPTLVFPSDNFLNNQKDVNLKIFAPHAEKVTVFVNKEAEGLALPDEELKDYFIFKAQNLPEEEISFYFKAERGEEEKVSQNYSLISDFSPPEIDLESSRAWVDEPAEGKEKIIQVEVYFNEKAKKAIATVEGVNINLAPSEESSLVWFGQIISFKTENSLTPITLPSVFVEDEAGNQARYDLEWENLEPAKTSLLDQYYLKKKYPSGPLKLILNIGSWFYRLLLIIFAIALILNIFIQIKHQNIKTILVSLLAIILLVALLLI
jgi:hypothetical protein